MTRADICETCRFYEGFTDNATGLCRRYAPRPVQAGEVQGIDGPNYRQWPEVEPDDWCGEWSIVRPSHSDIPRGIRQ